MASLPYRVTVQVDDLAREGIGLALNIEAGKQPTNQQIRDRLTQVVESALEAYRQDAREHQAENGGQVLESPTATSDAIEADDPETGEDADEQGSVEEDESDPVAENAADEDEDDTSGATDRDSLAEAGDDDDEDAA